MNIFVNLLILRVFSEKLPEIQDNIADEIIANQKYLMLNFYVNWCRFCVILKPEYDTAASFINSNYTDAFMTKINCEINSNTCSKYKINKYPTLMIFRHGISKKEYRGERTSSALIKYVVKDLQSEPFQISSLSEIDKTSSYIVGVFPDKHSHDYSEFTHVVMEFFDECVSYAIFKPSVKPHISFVSHSNSEKPEIFNDHISSPEFEIWVEEMCRPMIPEITFRNAEELTNDGTPLLLLFYNSGDDKAKKFFSTTLKKNQDLWKGKYKPVYAKATLFEHALRRLHKTPNNVPLIVVDDYNHLYEFEEYSKFNDRDEFIKFDESIQRKREEISIRFQQIIFGAFDIFPDSLPNMEKKLEAHYKKKITKEVEKPHEQFHTDTHKEVIDQNEEEREGFIKSVFKILAPNERRYTMARERDEL